MEFEAETAICERDEGGFFQVGWALPGNEAEYILITLPETDDPADDEFFGHNHYVEVRDQAYGRYGGLAGLTVLNRHQVTLRLNYEIPDLDAEISVATGVPMSGEVLAQLRRAEALVGRAD
ncbi:MAG: hypothetical protein QOD42_3579 [Sphingomonadales bacterium]|jgi:hypothetical protein|nr:hypothetical protein [Sphingomonadales bacterium]